MPRSSWLGSGSPLLEAGPGRFNLESLRAQSREEEAEQIEADNHRMAQRLGRARSVISNGDEAQKLRVPPWRRPMQPSGPRPPSGQRPPQQLRPPQSTPRHRQLFAEGSPQYASPHAAHCASPHSSPAPAPEDALPPLRPLKTFSDRFKASPTMNASQRALQGSVELFREHLTLDGFRACVTIKRAGDTALEITVDASNGRRDTLEISLWEAADVLGVVPEFFTEESKVSKAMREEAWRQLALCVRPSTPVRVHAPRLPKASPRSPRSFDAKHRQSRRRPPASREAYARDVDARIMTPTHSTPAPAEGPPPSRGFNATPRDDARRESFEAPPADGEPDDTSDDRPGTMAYAEAALAYAEAAFAEAAFAGAAFAEAVRASNGNMADERSIRSTNDTLSHSGANDRGANAAEPITTEPAAAYAAPAYAAPIDETPIDAVPIYVAPTYVAPTYDTAADAASIDAAPTYAMPTYAAPADAAPADMAATGAAAAAGGEDAATDAAADEAALREAARLEQMASYSFGQPKW
mmetsp:Transcript_26225/g.90126  ORF Transcript_26225/g.90126 Transcript_26225/m.90126 type:complete len:525 (+) Transcript_26225:52-1626(+)